MNKNVKTYGDFIKANPDDEGAKRLALAIEHDKRQKAENERLHPLANYFTQPMRVSINPTA